MQKVDREKFLRINAGLINKAANRYFFDTPKFSFDDLVSVGNQGALKALNHFDSSRRESKLTTYVFRAASREIRDFVRKNKHDLYVSTYSQRQQYQAQKRGETESQFSGPNSPMALRLDKEFNLGGFDGGVSTINVLPSGAPPPEQRMMFEEQGEILMQEINSLPPRDKSIIMQRHVSGATFSEIGDAHHITKQRAQQIEGRVMKGLRERLIPKLDGFIVREDGLARRT